MPEYLRFAILLAASWINRDQQKIIDYLLEEIHMYRKHLTGRRVRFTDEQRRRLGVKAKALGRKSLEQFAAIVTPDTLLELVLEPCRREIRRHPAPSLGRIVVCIVLPPRHLAGLQPTASQPVAA